METTPDEARAAGSWRSLLGKVRRRKYLFDGVLILAVVAYGLLEMRHFDLNMAKLHSDDGPILYSHAFKDPARFEGDYQVGAPLAARAHFKICVTLMNSIPAVSWRYLNVDPYLTTWLLAFVQGISIGLAVYWFVLVVTRSRTIAAMAVAFAYVATPWNWNLANYGATAGWNFLPYAGNLALAPVLLAFGCVLRKADLKAVLLLGAAALIHPTLALFAGGVAGLFWLMGAPKCERRKTLWRLGGLAAVALVAVLPALLMRMSLPDTGAGSMSRDEVIAGIQQNQHVWPWGRPAYFRSAASMTLKWLLLAVLAWRWRGRFSEEFGRLWLAALGCALLLGLSHLLGAALRIPLLLNLIGLRAFTWFSLMSLPLVMAYWMSHVRSGDAAAGALGLLCLFLPFYVSTAAPLWPMVAGLLLLDASQGHLSIRELRLPDPAARALRWGAVCVPVAWGALILAMPLGRWGIQGWMADRLGARLWPGELPSLTARLVLVSLVALAATALWLAHRRKLIVSKGGEGVGSPGAALLAGLLLLACAGCFFTFAVRRGQALRASGLAHAVDVQEWAREHTPPSAFFVAPADGWRTVALRRKLHPFTREAYAYIAPGEMKRHRNRLLSFYGIPERVGKEQRGRRVYKLQRKRFARFREKDFMRFADEFGTTHLVLPTVKRFTETTELDFPVAYRNPRWVVYELKR